MEYSIKITIPDELGTLVGILRNTEVKNLAQDLDLQAVSARKTAEPPADDAPQVTFADLKAAALKAAATPAGKDEGRKVLVESGIARLSDAPKEKWAGLISAFRKIAEKYGQCLTHTQD